MVIPERRELRLVTKFDLPSYKTSLEVHDFASGKAFDFGFFWAARGLEAELPEQVKGSDRGEDEPCDVDGCDEVVGDGGPRPAPEA